MSLIRRIMRNMIRSDGIKGSGVSRVWRYKRGRAPRPKPEPKRNPNRFHKGRPEHG